MSRKSERLFTLLGETKDAYIDDAGQPLRKAVKQKHYWRRIAVAACLCLSLGMGMWMLPQLGGCGGASSGEGHNEGSTFMSYAGPLLPLTLAEENPSVTARRTVAMDFSPWVPRWITNEEHARDGGEEMTEDEYHDRLDNYNEWFPKGGHYDMDDHILIHDRYVLTNNSPENQTVRIQYPFIATLENVLSRTPQLTLDGEALPYDRLLIGGFHGGYESAVGSPEGGSDNLSQLSSLEDYRTLLEQGQYRQDAGQPWPSFRGVPAVLYRITDARGPDDTEDMPNPSLRISFDLDYGRTNVQSFGFSGGSWAPEDGTMACSFSLARTDEQPEDKLMIVLGEDIQNITIGGYITGGVETEDTLPQGSYDYTLERQETSLEDALRLALQLYLDGRYSGMGIVLPDFDVLLGAVCEMFSGRDPLFKTDVGRYYGNFLEDILIDAMIASRVCYLEAEVTIPAEGAVSLSAETFQDASYDYCGSNTENHGVFGYDMAPWLDSSLCYAAQEVLLADHGQIEIVRQNFGFDPENHIDRVNLSPKITHYYLEVRRAADTLPTAPPQ